MSRPRVNCARSGYCRLLCRAHYSRFWRYGNARAVEFRTRFESRFVRGDDDSCWLWTGGRTHAGYGQIKRKQKQVRAHRASYELYVGPIPAGMHVLHRCDNPPCVNPAHLFLGTHIDNMRDMERKGRAKWIQENLRATP